VYLKRALVVAHRLKLPHRVMQMIVEKSYRGFSEDDDDDVNRALDKLYYDEAFHLLTRMFTYF